MWKNVFGLFHISGVVLTRETRRGDHLTPSRLQHVDDFVLFSVPGDSLTNYPFIKKAQGGTSTRNSPVERERTQTLNI